VVEGEEVQKPYAGQHAGSYTREGGRAEDESRVECLYRRGQREREQCSSRVLQAGALFRGPRTQTVGLPIGGLQDEKWPLEG
jgi:hypothetical protein